MAPFTALYPNGAATVGFSSPNDTMNHALVTGAIGSVKTCKNPNDWSFDIAIWGLYWPRIWPKIHLKADILTFSKEWSGLSSYTCIMIGQDKASPVLCKLLKWLIQHIHCMTLSSSWWLLDFIYIFAIGIWRIETQTWQWKLHRVLTIFSLTCRFFIDDFHVHRRFCH